MKLIATGFYVRAARTARFARATHPRIPQRYIANARRWNSSQAAAKQEYEPASIQPEHFSTAATPKKKPAQRSPASDHNQRSISESRPFKSQQATEADINSAASNNQSNTVTLEGRPYAVDSVSNLSSAVTSLIGRRLYDSPNHPICITRKLIESVFPAPRFANHVAYNPVATVEQNFDVLGFPKDHPGRSRTDTYYVNSNNVLRTHTSAHQHQAFQHLAALPNISGYTICADVYRRDSIDKSHFPVFHQMEGALCWQLRQPRDEFRYSSELRKARIKQIVADYKSLPSGGVDVVSDEGPQSHFNLDTNPPQPIHTLEEVRVAVTHLKRSLEELVRVVFNAAKAAGLGDESLKDGDKLQVRWVEAYFPFTSPSFELEVFWNGEWMELLGCGVVQNRILKNAGLNDTIAWAWGLGVERLAMLLFGVPDIRLFWSEDPRFLNQFTEGKITKFEPFSKYPACYKDIAFWINASSPPIASPILAQPGNSAAAAAGGDATKASPTESQPAAFHENDVMEIVRDIAGSLAEDVQAVDEFVHPTTGRKSVCYRINYRSLERTLTNDEVNEMHEKVRARIGAELEVELR